MPEDKKEDLTPIPNEPPCFKYVDLAKTAFGVVPDITEVGKQIQDASTLRDHMVTAVRGMADKMLAASKFNPQDLVAAISRQQPNIEQWNVHIPKSRKSVGAPRFEFVEIPIEDDPVLAFMSTWKNMFLRYDDISRRCILEDIAIVHQEALNLVTVATPHLHRSNWYFRQDFGHGSRIELHNTQYAGGKKKWHYKALVVLTECPNSLEECSEEFEACELKLASLLKGLPAKVTVSVRYGMLRIKIRWNRNVQNLFLKMLGDVVFPEIREMLNMALQPIQVEDTEALVGRGLSEHYLYLDPCDEADFIPADDNQETDDEK